MQSDDSQQKMQSDNSQHYPVVIITGLSGSGKSTALDVFEDMGYFTVDGLPAELAPQMVEKLTKASVFQHKGIALGMDLRQSSFVADLDSALAELRGNGHSPRIIFFEARPEVLMKRYLATRRPHPLEKEGLGLEQALGMECSRLKRLRKKADLVLDTSDHSIHDLRRVLQGKWKALHQMRRGLRVHLITFGFKYGTPTEADMVFDLRFLPNPYFKEALRPLSGLDAPVAEYVLQSEPGKTFFGRLAEFLEYVIDLYEVEGRFRLTIAIGCTGGRHRSVAVAEKLNERLQQAGFDLSLEHRHMALG